MKRQQTIRIENKNYDITLHENGTEALVKALDELRKRSDNVTAKQLLEAYLAKAAACEALKAELSRIEASLSAI
jgi:predicted transcriptional regulator